MNRKLKLQVDLRRMEEKDLSTVIKLFADLNGGNIYDQDATQPPTPEYRKAFESIRADPNNGVWVALYEGVVVGAIHLTIVQYLAYHGGRILIVENVIVDPFVRRRRVGETMLKFAIEEARRRGCFRVKLTSSKMRKQAHAFYKHLGFEASHEGFSMAIDA